MKRRDHGQHPDIIAALEALLEAEREALLAGDLAALADMLSDKEALVQSLADGGGCDLRQLHALDSKVRRNQLLLDGALEGIREVAGRMAALRQTRNGLDTYGSDGTRKNIPVKGDHSVERRA